MAKVIQEADYIQKRKKKYLTYTLIFFVIMMMIFLIGFIITRTRKNIFTVIAAVFTLVVAQYGVQFFSIIHFKDGDKKIAEVISNLPEDYIVWNSALLGDQIGMTLIEHIIISDKEIICLYDVKNNHYQKNLDTMKRIAQNKGLKEYLKFIKIEEEQLEKYIEQWSQYEIENHKKQEEILNALKTAAIV